MPPPKGFLLRLAARLAVAITLLPALPARAGERETWQVGGRTYADVRVREVTPATVTIFHRGGIAQLELVKLPPDLRARFRYDEESARAWADEKAAVLASENEARAAREARLREQPPAVAEHDSGSPEWPADPTPTAGGSWVELRSEVDLRPIYNEHGLFLKDQGRRPSCSIFAVVSALEYEIARRDSAQAVPLSEEFLIWAVTQVQPGIPIDDGFHFQEVIAALQTHGVPRFSLMPNTFGRKVEDIEPSEAARVDALSRRGVVAVWFRRDDPDLIARLVDTLNRGTPVILGVRWPHWRTLQNNNLLRDQQPLEDATHAITLVGYLCPSGEPEATEFIFRNSYGVSWGMRGCALVAPAYLREHLITAFYLTMPDGV